MAAWYSILPEHLTFYETLLIRIFLILGLINISPWALAILYDFFYYIARQIAYEIPIYGGRAQGAARPSAPNLRDPSRRRRSIAEMISGDSPGRLREEQRAELRRRHQHHQRTTSYESIPEEDSD